MILIKKFPAPSDLETLKKEAEEQGLSDKDGYAKLRNPLKTQVRNLLMQEQGHLCAYCMRRIPDIRILEEDVDLSDVYIEHWQARSAVGDTTENKGLDYRLIKFKHSSFQAAVLFYFRAMRCVRKPFCFSIVSTVNPVFLHGDEFRRFVYFYVSVTDKICRRHFQVIHQPDNKIRRCIVPQDQVAALLQNAESCLHFSAL